ncbi:MAG: flagellar hook capping FlgD N-terminal domain-containing protein [Terracidiphilus sp.]|jgi:flagellar basal-body rod modification protein FlgD
MRLLVAEDDRALGLFLSRGLEADSSATISANDFLTLLVTEMQNQDPTSDTDPNEYINQLVQVNSLEQLIDINQTLSTDAGSTSGADAAAQAVGEASNPTNSATPASAAASPHAAAHLSESRLSTTSGATAANASTSPATSTQHFSGNLSVPNASPAAQRVGHALAGRTHAAPVVGNSPAAE